MKNTRWKKLVGMAALLTVGVALGSTVPPAHAQRHRSECTTGFNKASPSSYGFVCQSTLLTCPAKHVASNPIWNGTKKKFEYRCTKEANVPK